MQISVHPANDMESVYKFIPQEYFASDMGGNAPSFEAKKGINIYINIFISIYIKLTAIKMKYASNKKMHGLKSLLFEIHFNLKCLTWTL